MALGNLGKYSQLLQNMPNPNTGTHAGGLSHVLQQALLGYSAGQDQRAEEAKRTRLADALRIGMGTPENNIAWNSLRPDGSGEMNTPIPAVPGDWSGMIGALGQDFPELSLQMMGQERNAAAAAAAAEAARADALFDADAANAQEMAMAQFEVDNPDQGSYGTYLDPVNGPVTMTAGEAADRGFVEYMPPGGDADQPSAVREWIYFNSLPPEAQQRFLAMKRANPLINLGDAYVQPDPLNPGNVAGSFGVGIAPSQVIIDNQVVKIPSTSGLAADQFPSAGNGGAPIEAPGEISTTPIPGLLPELTEGQIQADKTFATDIYVPFITGGGFADARKQIDQLLLIKDQLTNIVEGNSDANLSGSIIGLTPDLILNMFNPDAVDARQQVEEVVQRNLRVVLGAQFAQKEGEALIARAYNPSQEEAVNRDRLIRLLDAMEIAMDAKLASTMHFEKAGTLANFEGTAQFSPEETLDLLNAALDDPESDSGDGWGEMRVIN
jgi:hypothetical protein